MYALPRATKIARVEDSENMARVIIRGHVSFIALARAVLEIVGKETGK